MIRYLTICTFLFGSISLFAQNDLLVKLKDKGSTVHSLQDILSERSIQKRINNNIEIDESDLPVHQAYLKNLADVGEIKKVSKWLNTVLLSTELSIEEILAFNFVEEVEILVSAKKEKPNEELVSDQKNLDYGLALPHIEQLNIECVHNQGILGEDIIVAVLDGGFRGFDTIPAFDSLFIENRLVDTWDFVDMDDSVYEKSTHGTRVSSVITGNQPNYVSAAPKVQLCLYIAEDVSEEVNSEEFDLVLGLERADSIGADLVNISLGYFNFDSLQTDHTFDDLDGHTTPSTIGIQMAIDKGILVVTSAGNSGPSHITTPCDADSILCVGATNTQNELAGFSSLGPTADGRIKPDVVAMGAGINCVGANGDIGPCFGTSFSSPLVAGMTALLIQAHPNLTIHQVMDAVRMSGHQADNPDNLFGYGIPDACVADSLLSELEIPSSILEITESQFKLYPNPANGFVKIESENSIEIIHIYSIDGKLVRNINGKNGRFQELNLSNLERGMYLVALNSESWERLILE